jgi:hypothetical protein
LPCQPQCGGDLTEMSVDVRPVEGLGTAEFNRVHGETRAVVVSCSRLDQPLPEFGVGGFINEGWRQFALPLKEPLGGRGEAVLQVGRDWDEFG